MMSLAYALVAVGCSAVAGAVLWPVLGWWTLAASLLAGNVACLLVAFVEVAKKPVRLDEMNDLTDEMVADLRQVLQLARRTSAWEHDNPAAAPSRRAAG